MFNNTQQKFLSGVGVEDRPLTGGGVVVSPGNPLSTAPAIWTGIGTTVYLEK